MLLSFPIHGAQKLLSIADLHLASNLLARREIYVSKMYDEILDTIMV